MAAWLPHKKGFSGYATRFVGKCNVPIYVGMLTNYFHRPRVSVAPSGPCHRGVLTSLRSVGFALGWNYLFKYLIGTFASSYSARVSLTAQ